MSKKEKQKRRKHIVGTMLVGFIGITVVLTFFSKSLYNYRLPVVTVTSPKQGELDFSVEGTAKIDYAESKPYYPEVDGKIKELLIKKGDTVEAGQCLMKIAETDSYRTKEVKAVEDGIITSVAVKEGIYVSATGNEALCEEASVTDVWNVTLLTQEEAAEDLATGSRAVLKLSKRNLTLDGEVTVVEPYTDDDFDGTRVEIQVHSEDESIAGEKADVTIEHNSLYYDTLIPAAALRKDDKGYYVGFGGE